MKNGKRPTREQRMRLERYNLNAANWLIVKNAPDCFVIVNKITGAVRVMQRTKGC